MRSYINTVSSKKTSTSSKTTKKKQTPSKKANNTFKKYSFELINSAYAGGRPQENH